MSVATESCPVEAAEGLPASRIESHRDCTIIEPRPGWQLVDLRELWAFRELLYFLIWRDVKVRYKQTLLGAAWAILQPLAQMVVLSAFFGRLLDGSDLGVPYPLFAFAGLLPWNFFGNAVASAAGSMIGNQGLITKVYFPRLFLPGSAVGVAAIDFLIAFAMLFVLMLYYGVGLPASLLLAPLMILGLTLAALGVGTMLAALTVAYRDFRYVVPFMVQLWMFATPAVYMNSSSIDPHWQWLLPLNPAHGFIMNFRRAALGQELDLYALVVSLAVTLVLLLGGCLYFRRVERTFADII